MASRLLEVEELAEILARGTDSETSRGVPPEKSSRGGVIHVAHIAFPCQHQLVQFAHLSVNEFLMYTRFPEKCDTTSSRYHVSMELAYTAITQACLGALLHLSENITRSTLERFPLSEYAAEHWFEHARFRGYVAKWKGRMKQLSDRRRPHFAGWLWICDPAALKRPLPPHGTTYTPTLCCRLRPSRHCEVLAIEHPRGVNSRSFDNE